VASLGGGGEFFAQLQWNLRGIHAAGLAFLYKTLRPGHVESKCRRYDVHIQSADGLVLQCHRTEGAIVKSYLHARILNYRFGIEIFLLKVIE